MSVRKASGSESPTTYGGSGTTIRQGRFVAKRDAAVKRHPAEREKLNKGTSLQSNVLQRGVAVGSRGRFRQVYPRRKENRRHGLGSVGVTSDGFGLEISDNDGQIERAGISHRTRASFFQLNSKARCLRN